MKTFNIGGIHPPENKLSANVAITTLAIPEEVIIPLGQHIGAPAKAIVTKGDTVKVGQLIAEANGFISANIHSSVSGTVTKVDKTLDSSGFSREAVFIKVEGDEWVEGIDTTDHLVQDCKFEAQEIIDKVKACGIVGMGGATFPTNVKLSPPPDKKAEVLIINAVECEPYLTADHQIMMEKGEEVMVGVNILKRALKVDRAIIGIENNKPDAIELMTNLASKHLGIEICPLKVQYPQGGEKQLINATINREVPSGKLPIEVGAVVQNVGTAFAVYEAIQKNKPLIERIVTVTGKSVEKPSNFLVRIGTSLNSVIEAAGGTPEDTGKVIGGGPMMGKALSSTNVPIVKGSSGVLLMPGEESFREEMSDCIRCSKCISACAMGLEPYLLMLTAQKGLDERSHSEHIMDCIECGSCSYTCPAQRPLLDYIRLGKGRVGAMLRAKK
jgi:electron transport complex protein RnfC